MLTQSVRATIARGLVLTAYAGFASLGFGQPNYHVRWLPYYDPHSNQISYTSINNLGWSGGCAGNTDPLVVDANGVIHGLPGVNGSGGRYLFCLNDSNLGDASRRLGG